MSTIGLLSEVPSTGRSPDGNENMALKLDESLHRIERCTLKEF
jgi:hypothetical protein